MPEKKILSTSESRVNALQIGDQKIIPGERITLSLPVGYMISHELVSIPITVTCGKNPGPTLLVCAGAHGDEINGVEIARTLNAMKSIRRKLHGTLIIVPVINMPAFLSRSRYLPDRRDLNRLFPGSASGSLGARLAKVFFDEILKPSTHVVDMHTGALNRPNLPQIRLTDTGNGEMEMARMFAAPVTLTSATRPGTLRDAVAKQGTPLIMYEAGEAMRLDVNSVRFGVRGILGVMHGLGMLPNHKQPKSTIAPVFCRSSYWERAPRGGIFVPKVKLGRAVNPGDVLGSVRDPFGSGKTPLVAKDAGIVIGRSNLAITDEGDGVFHIALSDNPNRAEARIERNEESMLESLDRPVRDDPLID